MSAFDSQVDDLLLIFYHNEIRYSRGEPKYAYFYHRAISDGEGRIDAENADKIKAVFEKRGLGSFSKLSDGVTFQLSDFGRAEALRILEERRPKSLGEKLSAIPRSDWIALLALVVSALSAYFTYLTIRSQ